MNWSIDFAPLIPEPLFWTVTVLAALLIALMFLRGTRGASMRALAVLALLLALANPTLREEERDYLTNIAIVVIDETTSQALAGRPEQSAAIRAELETRLGNIDKLEVKWVTAKSDTTGRASGSNLFTALSKAMANTPPDRIAGVIMVTDGQVHDVPEKAANLGFEAPIHALVTGRPGEFDRRIEIITAPRYGIVGQSRDIELRIVEAGTSGSRSPLARLKIRREGQPDESITTQIGVKETIEFPLPHAGTNILEVELESVDGELTQANNRAVVAAEGVRENLRVLLVSGEPHAGERTWRNLLKSDAAVDLVHFTILRPPEKQDGTPINQLSLIAFPTRELFSDKINDFDLIIFDRYTHRGILRLGYYDNIARYVDEHGGAVLIAAGDDFAGRYSLYRTPLNPVIPGKPLGRVIEKPFKPKLSDDGQRHPVTRDLPGASGTGGEPSWGRWFRQVDVEVDTNRGRTLMNGADNKPLLILDRRGEGRIALLTSDHAWLWARGFEGGGPHTDLLRKLSHWLMKEPDLEDERLIAEAKGLNLTIERHSMSDEVETVKILSPGGEDRTITLDKVKPGVWRKTIEVKLPGLYKAESDVKPPVGKLTAVAYAGTEDPREMSEVTATVEKLKPITNATGGGEYWTKSTGLLAAGDPGAVTVPRVSMLKNAHIFAGSGWLGLHDREAYITRGVKLTPMMTGFAALAALLGLLSLAWWREGR
ncbi:MAG: hypothetical protein KJ622_12340 [Alphaproteobacteria bacterium]|nr:hypothetical protein [Alphaproteobacteria bacterium]